MESSLAGMRRLTRWGLWFGGALVLLAALLIGVDVVLRKFFTRSIGGADELAGYALAIGSAWGLAAALVDRAHIRIDSLYILFPSWLRIVLDFAGLALFIAFFTMVAWHGSGVVMQSWTSGSRSQSDLQTPTVIPQVLWIAGLILFVVVGIVLILEALAQAQSGRPGRHRPVLIGTRSAEEEVEEEIRALEERQANGGQRLMLVTTLVILIGLLALARAGRGRPGGARARTVDALFAAAAVAGHGRDQLGNIQQLPAGGDPVLRAAGRDPAALGDGGADVQRAGAVDPVAARRPDAFQHCRVRNVRSDLRIERGDCRHHRHGRHGRNREARLFRAAVSRYHRRRRYARHPHPTLNQHDRLRGADRHVDPQALSRWRHPRAGARRPLQPHCSPDLFLVAAPRRQADLGHLGRTHPRPSRSHPAAGDLPGRDRLDLRRLGHRDRGRGVGRGGCTGRRRRAPAG